MEGQARMIGSLQSIGLDDRLLATLPAKLDSITVADIKRLAKISGKRQSNRYEYYPPKGKAAQIEASKSKENN